MARFIYLKIGKGDLERIAGICAGDNVSVTAYLNLPKRPNLLCSDKFIR